MRAILTYHSVDPSGSPISVDEAAFARHVEILAGRPGLVVPLDEIAGLPDDNDAIAITFDDGFENFASRAWPLLRDAGLPATVFLVAGEVGRTNAWGGREEPGIPTLDLFGWDEAGRLSEEGAGIGSHSMTHPRLDRLEPVRIDDEVAGSRSLIRERIGVDPVAFAYPYGDLDPTVTMAVGREYGVAVTTELRLLCPADDPCLLPRLDAYYLRESKHMGAFGTPGFRRRIAVRRALRALRRRLARHRRGEVATRVPAGKSAVV